MKLAQARQYALSLPETTEAPHFEFSSYRVRGKIFATVPPAGTHLHIFVEDADRAPLIAADPETFAALRWGAKVVGVRVTLAGAQPRMVERLLLASWKRKAPKALAAGLD